MELLNQMDGFDTLGQTKIIMATNRPDTLDPALLRAVDWIEKLKLVYLMKLEDWKSSKSIHQKLLNKVSLILKLPLK